MMTYKFAKLHKIVINPRKEAESRFQIRLLFRGIERPETVEFELSGKTLMGLMFVLQQLQVRHRIPIPAKFRGHGKPNLRIVKIDD